VGREGLAREEVAKVVQRWKRRNKEGEGEQGSGETLQESGFFFKNNYCYAHNNIFYSALTEHFSIVYGNSQLFYLLVHFTLAQSKRFQKKKFENISL
jgi:hypothetical protein